MLILAVETSTATGSVALAEASFPAGSPPVTQIIGETTLNLSETHSSRLAPVIDRILRETSRTIQKVRGIAVGLGPGSFTGLRIAVSTVKGLAFALRVPVAGVSTLDTLASNIPFTPWQVCPVLDARKKEVYAALFRGTGEGEVKRVSKDWVLSPEDLCSRISEKTILVGNGAEAYGEVFRRELGPRALFAPPELSFPRAANLARLSLPAFRDGTPLHLFSFTPLYVRRSEAEIQGDRKDGQDTSGKDRPPA